MPNRHTYDPFAPPVPRFPTGRLQRAGVPDQAIAHLADRYEEISQTSAVRFVQRVRQQSDTEVARRFTPPANLEALGGYTAAALDDLAHSLGLSGAGTKAETQQRILDHLEGQDGSEGTDGGEGAEGGEQEQAPPMTDTEQPAEQVVGQPTTETITPENAAIVEHTHPDGSTTQHTGEIPAEHAVQPAEVPEAVVGSAGTSQAMVEQPATPAAPAGKRGKTTT